MSQGSQFRLLAQRRFLPFFGAQAFGAFNDNVYKNVLVIVATYQAASYTQLDPELLTNMAGGLFILPYVLFSGIAGQLADRFDKALVLKVVKAAEIVIMAIAALGFAAHSIEVLLGALFLMGVHSTFFAPAKYGLLPEVLEETELVGGNALVEMGTFLAILLGTLAAGLLAAEGSIGAISAALIVVAVAGFATSMSIPSLRPAAPDLRIDWRPWTSTWDNIRAARESRAVFQSILGISWFWFYGALVLAQLPLFAKNVLGGSEQIVTLLLVLFSAGIGIGSLLCERLSGRKVEIGLVPFGSIGLTAFAVDLYFAVPDSPPRHGADRGAVRRAAGLVARADGSRPDRRVRRLLHRAALRTRAAARTSRSDVARDRREQHPERRLHGRRRAPRSSRAQRGTVDRRAAAAHRHSQRVRRGVHLSARAGIPAALPRVAARALHLPARNARPGQHSGARPCPADLQPRRLRRRAGHFRGLSAADPLHHGSGHLPHSR